MVICSRGDMLRQLRVKHPAKVSKKNKTSENTSTSGPEDMETDGGHFCSVEVTLEDTHSSGNEADINSAINGILEAAQGGPAGQISQTEAGNNHPERRKRNKRSLIWRHFEHLDSLSAARCRICMKKLQCFEGGSTSNLHRHMSKRHPEVFSQIATDTMTDGQNSLPPDSSQASHGTADVSTPPEAVCTTGRRRFSGSMKVMRASGTEKRVFRRERELIEALRRAQKEEAQALDYQRELLQKLRAANAREAAAEREEIESLRKTQLKEAEDLNRQKEELQKKWEELRREKEELFMFSNGQQAS